jgi:hypothetical protein
VFGKLELGPELFENMEQEYYAVRGSWLSHIRNIFMSWSLSRKLGQAEAGTGNLDKQEPVMLTRRSRSRSRTKSGPAPQLRQQVLWIAGAFKAGAEYMKFI